MRPLRAGPRRRAVPHAQALRAARLAAERVRLGRPGPGRRVQRLGAVREPLAHDARARRPGRVRQRRPRRAAHVRHRAVQRVLGPVSSEHLFGHVRERLAHAPVPPVRRPPGAAGSDRRPEVPPVAQVAPQRHGRSRSAPRTS